MSLKVGITGGMGAGKSMVAEIFRTFGIPIYNADLMAKKLMDNHPALKESIRATFGEGSYIDGHLNRSFLAQTIFSSEENLARMNELVHPVVINDYENWHRAHSLKLYTIKEAALLFESGSYKDLDKIILVLAPLTIRLQRILLRDQHRTRADIENIMARQMNDKDKKKLADFIIINDEHKMVIPQVLDIHDKLLNVIKQD
jgi:dephospho-CoA kinase